jgi:hypothetical protein
MYISNHTEHYRILLYYLTRTQQHFTSVQYTFKWNISVTGHKHGTVVRPQRKPLPRSTAKSTVSNCIYCPIILLKYRKFVVVRNMQTSGGIEQLVSFILNLDTKWWVESSTLWPLCSRYPLAIKVGGPQSRSGWSCCAGDRTTFLRRTACSLITASTELSQVHLATRVIELFVIICLPS